MLFRAVSLFSFIIISNIIMGFLQSLGDEYRYLWSGLFKLALQVFVISLQFSHMTNYSLLASFAKLVLFLFTLIGRIIQICLVFLTARPCLTVKFSKGGRVAHRKEHVYGLHNTSCIYFISKGTDKFITRAGHYDNIKYLHKLYQNPLYWDFAIYFNNKKNNWVSR